MKFEKCDEGNSDRQTPVPPLPPLRPKLFILDKMGNLIMKLKHFKCTTTNTVTIAQSDPTNIMEVVKNVRD